jgi:hypothetical protein
MSKDIENIDWELCFTQAKGLANMVSVAGRSLEGEGDAMLAGGLLSIAAAISEQIDLGIDRVMAELSKAQTSPRPAERTFDRAFWQRRTDPA